MGKKNITKKEMKDTVVLDFSFPTSLVSIKVDGFNNFLKNDTAAFKKINYCLNDLAEKVIQSSPSELYCNVGKHNHPIKNEKLSILENAIKEAYRKLNPTASKENVKNFYDQNFKETAFYQLGLNGSIRLLGFFEKNHHFKVVLIDYYHTLYPNEKYNHQDQDNYNVCFYDRGKN